MPKPQIQKFAFVITNDEYRDLQTAIEIAKERKRIEPLTRANRSLLASWNRVLDQMQAEYEKQR